MFASANPHFAGRSCPTEQLDRQREGERPPQPEQERSEQLAGQEKNKSRKQIDALFLFVVTLNSIIRAESWPVRSVVKRASE